MINSSRIYNCRKRSKFRGIFNGIFVLIFLFLFACKEQIHKSLFTNNPFPNLPQNSNLKIDFRRKLYQNPVNNNILRANRNPTICSGIHQHDGYSTKCDYLKANPECNSGGYFGYLEFFYCDCNNYKPLAYISLALWLLALFYLLGNTAADYFCCCLEKLSYILKLPPTVAGVTLLPLGNGAPDVFSSIASFVGRDSGDVGLNSVLGGAVFVTCIVVGTVSICVSELNVRIDKKCFIRDVGFFLFTVVSLLCILFVGKVSLFGAIAFVSIYVVYTLWVGAGEVLRKYGKNLKFNSVVPLLPVTGSMLCNENEEDEALRKSLLDSGENEIVPHLKSKLPKWMWNSNVAIFSNESVKIDSDEKNLWGWNEEDAIKEKEKLSCFCSKVCCLLEFPLALPRRLTIPIVEEERWSKVYAVGSAFFAPMVLAFLWNTLEDSSRKEISYIIGALVGGVLGILAVIYTSSDHPPRKFLLPWVLGGFCMSIIWFYIIANELVAVLVAFGVILRIKSSLLALTVLAWGNSMGDLMSNVAIAMNGANGVQVAISGSFAGPMFNTLVGLGVPLMIGAWSKKPEPYVVPIDYSLYLTLGFLTLGLVWSLVVLPRNGMRPSKLLGGGLVAIYVGFLTLRGSIALGDGSLNDSS